ncbi:MAG: type II toxin-antitoxin system RelE/ParE family toxin [Proteobacteria bacterium]|nr:type II toxin-antitoxin system RelE/ParE family toxin [Pseudomonadota bacterium]
MTKLYKVLIPQSVKTSLQHQVDYITNEQNAPAIALEWLDGLIKAVQSLAEFPDRCAVAPEDSFIKKDSKTAIRHFIYKKTFRIIFTVKKDEVRILSVKHSARLPSI